jgi:hypothetical protein
MMIEKLNLCIDNYLLHFREEKPIIQDEYVEIQNINLKPFKELFKKVQTQLQQEIPVDKDEKAYFQKKLEQKEM